jgi:hypothetical protein
VTAAGLEGSVTTVGLEGIVTKDAIAVEVDGKLTFASFEPTMLSVSVPSVSETD